MLGDNLEVLKLLYKPYAGRVKLIYIDPPYNTGNDFIYPDDFRDTLSNYLKQTDDAGKLLRSNPETSCRYHSDWLSMMYPRLFMARQLLRDEGVIFVSIDDHEVHHMRMLMNEVFGEENFVASIIWQHSLQPKGYQGTFSVHHNYVLCFQRSEFFSLGALERTEEHNKNYSNPDNDPRGEWRSGDVRSALLRPNLIFDIVTPSGKTIAPPPNGWRWSKETIAMKIASGEIVFSADESRITRKIVTVHPIHSFGPADPARWAAMHPLRNSSALRFCKRSVPTTVKIRSTNRQPPALWQPNDFFRHNTARRCTRSA